MQTNTKVLLSSGGMDSFLLAHEPQLQGAVHVFVDVGQKYLHKEANAALRIATEMNAPFYHIKTAQLAKFEHSTGIIPFRNAEMLLCAAQYGTELYLGVIADEINSDKSVEFCSAMERVLNISHRAQYWTEGKTYYINTPFRMISKSALANRFLHNGGQLKDLLNTVSCYSGTENHCGQCASCFKRWVALTNAMGRNDWKYWGFDNNPYEWKTLEQWDGLLEAYTLDRASEILSAFNLTQK
jgi:7-cyano-7-deazaguanine synthase